MEFKVHSRYNLARVSTLSLPHGTVQTPTFMPVGTHGAMKGVTCDQLDEIGYRLILGNTYHLAFHPGSSIVDQHGKLHGFMKWK